MTMHGDVDTAPFRERVQQLLDAGEPAARIALRAGFVRADGRGGCSTRLMRAVGLRPDISHGRRWTRKAVTYDVARRLAEGLDLDPIDVGL